MGNLWSDPDSASEGILATKDAWRKTDISWTPESRVNLKSTIARYDPKWLKLQHVNIFLIGPVGVGKSSFCNTVNSIFHDETTHRLQTGPNVAAGSTTLMFRSFEIYEAASASRPMKFRLCDTIGIEENYEMSNIPLLLDGNMADRTQFNPKIPFSQHSAGYVPHPKLHDKMHVVCYVLDGNVVDVLNQIQIDQIAKISQLAKDRGIPVMVLLTKIDLLCAHVRQDVTNVYRSIAVRDTVETLAGKTRIDRYHIVPVKSYETGGSLELPIDVLALSALRKMLGCADDFLAEEMGRRGLRPGSVPDP